MPNWKIHLEVGKIIGKKIKYNKEDMQLFMLGNILPDINNGILVKNISKELEHELTHYRSEKVAGYINFYNINKNNLENPVICGYLVHLYTDFLFNRDFYLKNSNVVSNNKSYEELRNIKHRDFNIYNNKFIENKLIIDNINNAVNMSKSIENISINEEDIVKAINYIKNCEKYGNQLQFYTEKGLDELLENTIVKLENFLRTLWIIRDKKNK